MIVDSDTIVDPWAMMIEAVHTLIANQTMSRPWSLDHLTVWTQCQRIENL